MERPEMRKKRSGCDPVLKKKRKRANKEEEEEQEQEQAIGAKRQRRHKPEGDEVVPVDAGSSKEERRRRRKHEEKKKKKKKKKRMEEEEEKKNRSPKPDEPNRRKKVVKWRLREKLLRFIRTREAMGHFATRPPMIRSKMAKLLFDRQLRREVAAEFEENKEFDSYVLHQYRTKGYFEVREEVDTDKEDAAPEIRYFVSDYSTESESECDEREFQESE